MIMLTDTSPLNDVSARQYQSLDQQIIGLLDSICHELEITDAMFKTAEERYHSIAGYLGDNDSPLAIYRPKIYPQGSINTGTTVKPPTDGEFDVDVICQLAIIERTPQKAFLDLVFQRLQQRGIYTLRRMNRCVRVQYANEFHIDITPGIPDLDQGPENILVTDKQLGKWKESNPKDYGSWFKRAAALQPVLIYERGVIRAKAAAEPLPAPQFTKPALNRVVQLLKRHRDTMFNGHKDAPISAIIATLAAQSYAHHAKHEQFYSRVDFLKTVVAAMPVFITRINEEELVPNPANPLENYADKWQTKPHRRQVFYDWHKEAVSHFEDILNSLGRGKQELFESLSAAYGDGVVKAAAVHQAEVRRTLMDNQLLGITRDSGIAAPIVGTYSVGKSVLPVKKHTNFGT